MLCAYCGHSLAENDTKCTNCGNPVSPVSVLPPEEREAFNGLTIDQDTGEQADGNTGNTRRRQERVYFRHVHLGGKSIFSGIFTLVTIGFIIAAILFFALPAIMLFMAAGVVLWFLRRLFL